MTGRLILAAQESPLWVCVESSEFKKKYRTVNRERILIEFICCLKDNRSSLLVFSLFAFFTSNMSHSSESSKSTNGSAQGTENTDSSEATDANEPSTGDGRAEYLRGVVDMRLELKEQRLEMVAQLKERVDLVSSVSISQL